MEYGKVISDTAGNKHFLVEGCTSCSMSSGGLHETHCSYYQREKVIEPLSVEEVKKVFRGQAVVARDYTFPDGQHIFDEGLLRFYKKKGYI